LLNVSSNDQPKLPEVIDFHTVVDMVITTLDIRDPYTFEHSYRVAGLAEILAEAMNIFSPEKDIIHYSAHLHDIGKIGVSDEILNKPGKLTNEEIVQIQSHSAIGSMILSKNPEFRGIARIVRHHHERWDGNGYPNGLTKENIPIESRIIGLVDAFDAMTSDRPYRKSKSHEWALKEIREHAGSQFCPKCVEAFLTLRSKLKLSQFQSSQKATTQHQANFSHDDLMHSQRVEPIHDNKKRYNSSSETGPRSHNVKLL